MIRLCALTLCLLASVQLASAKLKAKCTIENSEEGRFHVMKLDASKSTDAETYKWTLLNSDDKGKELPYQIVTYKNTEDRRFKWRLEVCDGAGTCKTKTCRSKKFEERGPHVEATMGLATTGTYHVMNLDASESYDNLGGGIASYEWEMLQGDNVGYTNDEATFTYDTHEAGIYKWQITICDDDKICNSATIETEFKHVPPPAPLYRVPVH